MAATVACVRCGKSAAPALTRPPLPGALGREIQAQNCADCWAEWTRTEVMVINELRLNFMDPAAQEILTQQMRAFLNPALRPGNPEPPA
ncbi:MAG TPA: oxidative damage protection protein [Thermoanaerobaculia bacterium]|nr:oxidative damage protection protein [Thermoanaerobaculia bacterium]